jgi:hypothetical protein
MSIQDKYKWIPFEIKPQTNVMYARYLVWYRGYYGKVEDGDITIGIYDKNNQKWNILESNNIRECVPTHYAEINPPKDKSADSPLSYSYDYDSPTMNVNCKWCDGSVDVSNEDFNLLPITIDDIIHDEDCELLADNEVK